MSERIRIVLVEDQAMVLGALEALLGLEPDLHVVATAPDGHKALAVALEHRPDVLITDIEMPSVSGLQLAQTLKDHGVATKVIVLTTFARPGYLQRALEAGARGYLLKDSPSRELADAIRHVHTGEQVFNARLAAEALVESNPLTEREREVLALAETGARSGDIARLLNISKGTVRNHLSQAISKLAAGSRVEAARIAKGKGWL